MKRQPIALLACAVLSAGMLAGCHPSSHSSETSGGEEESVDKAQMVVALNPVLNFSGGSVVAYNDIKTAMKSDSESASLTAIYNKTSWRWGYRRDEQWKERGIYALEDWKNGKGATPSKAPRAYSFVGDGTISVGGYAVSGMSIIPYAGSQLPAMGILLSVSGEEEEALCYTATENGRLSIPAGTVTAVDSVDGIKTGFLAEDGTPRRAAVRIVINSRKIWSGQLANTTASPDGTAITEVNYPEISDIPVTAGDMVFISFQLDAEVNVEGDASQPADEDSSGGKSDSSYKPEKPVTHPDSSVTSSPESSEPNNKLESISLIDGYDSRFTIVRSADASAEMLKQVTALRAGMIKVLETDQPYKTDDFQSMGGYEILVGETNRPESAAVLRELVDARTNHASDYIIRMVGEKLVIAASNDFSMSLAVEYFLKHYCQDENAVIPSNLNVVYRPVLQNVMLGNNNIASFVLRTEKYPSYMTVLAAQDLQRQIMRQTGYQVSLGKDTEKSAYEIHLGPSTNETVNSVTGKKDLPQNLLANINDYKISLSGNRMTIEGGSTTAVNEAVQVLVAEMQSGKAAFSDGYIKTGVYKSGEYSLSDGYGLKWFDDFLGDKMTKKWHQDTETLPTFDGTTMIKNGLFGEDYFLRDGCLVQTTRKRKDADGYHVVRTTTENLMNFRYGYLEVRLIMPTNNGACGAVWMEGKGLNQVNYPEIDLNENYGIDGYQPNMHSWPSNSETGSPHWQMWAHNVNTWQTEENWVYPEEGEHFYDTFHYLGMDWTKDYIAFYLDGQITKYVDLTSAKYDVFEQSVVLKIGTMVAFDQGYGIKDPPDYMDDVSKFYEECLVDFVRIYQKDDNQYKLKAKG